MKRNIFNSISMMILASLSAGTLGCSLSKNVNPTAPSAAALSNAGIAGSGSVIVPTADAVVARLEMGLAGNASSTANGSNFMQAVSQIRSNLPANPNPLLSSGLDQIPLLVYAACSDVKPSAYSVNTAQSVATQKSGLVAAGVQMLDRYVGGLASQSAQASQIAAVFSSLVDQDNTAGASTKTTFISVCMAANSYGVAMKGF